ncbi:uncharacterized protein METZ01_LOCUS382818 [marine metagenome]|uniref:SUI1 domain-containing protein n=1 Tax=marine metagenome TaxID=408172 RepID=A0A382U6N5_9ZZZZ|tara:strand:+ start:439 stop:762 length:324 start_codon:yes stop_codon:yes gene_type:complete
MVENSKLVYSTDSNLSLEEKETIKNVSNSDQDLRIWLENKPGGKKATIVRGFNGSKIELKQLGQKLRSLCHVGGTTKKGEIMVQGNVREQVYDYLIKTGYNAKLSGG